MNRPRKRPPPPLPAIRRRVLANAGPWREKEKPE